MRKVFSEKQQKRILELHKEGLHIVDIIEIIKTNRSYEMVKRVIENNRPRKRTPSSVLSAKGSLTNSEFIELCKTVVSYNGFIVTRDSDYYDWDCCNSC